MPTNSVENKFKRVFDDLADVRERVVKIEVHEENEQRQLEEVKDKLDNVSATLHEIIGKESVRSGIYGVIGAVVSGIVVWLITLVKGN